MTAILSAAAGITVANIYYNQSLLELLAREFGASAAQVGSIAVATQLGYATGLLFLVPLGDTVDRKRLIVGSALGASAILLLLAGARGLTALIGLSYLLGTISVTPQFIIPYAAGLAPDRQRGRIVGLVMSGLLVGILAARALSGFVASWFGWRSVFVLGAAVTAATGLLLLRIPRVRVEQSLSYPRLLRSLPGVLRNRVVLRHGLIGALGFAAFSAFWTTLGFYLASRPEHYGSRAVGLFGLIAVAGALVAPVAGRLSDRHSARAVNGISIAVIVTGFLLMSASNASLAALVAAVFIMDAGVQANQISNQTRIYALPSHLRNRITSVYMVTYFIGGAAGSAVGSYAWSAWGWHGVWITGATVAALAWVPLLTIRDTDASMLVAERRAA